ncbi:MAG: response regulator [Gemmataceae bacterium]
MGHAVTVVPSAEQAFAAVAAQSPNVIILDVRPAGDRWTDGAAAAAALAPDAAVIVVTAFGNLPTAVGAVEGGAFDYLTKPFDLSQALDAVARALHRPPPVVAAEEPPPAGGPEKIIGASPAMQAVFKRIALVARMMRAC